MALQVTFHAVKNGIRARKRAIPAATLCKSMAYRAASTAVSRAAAAIRDADALLVTAGAGIGVDSGLPDFRGNEGFWKAYPPLKELGIQFMEMANPAWFYDDPELAWGFYGHRLHLYRDTVPHAGFGLLKKWMKQMPMEGYVFTSNVDGQFQKAGFSEDQIMECHGSIHHIQCLIPVQHFAPGGGARDIHPADNISVPFDPATFRVEEQHLPRCPGGCSTIARPNILMFGDSEWVGDRTEKQRRRRDAWVADVKQQGAKTVIIDVGAGKAVPTVRNTAETMARHVDGTLIRINPRDTDIPSNVANGISIASGCLEALEAIDDALAA